MSKPKIGDRELKELIVLRVGVSMGYDETRAGIRAFYAFSTHRFSSAWKQVQAERAVKVMADAAAASRELGEVVIPASAIVAEPDWDALADKAQAILKNTPPMEYTKLAEKLKVPVDVVLRVVGLLVEKKYNIVSNHDTVELRTTLGKSSKLIIDTSKWATRHHIYGLTGDNHLASRYERLDVLNALFDIWERAGVKKVYQAGNIIDGECRFNVHDLRVHGIKGQTDYLIDNWPVRDGMITEFVTGDDHEGWYVQREGLDIGEHIEMQARKQGRDDLRYIGHMEKNVEFRAGDGCSMMQIVHAGGGTAYAISYTVQKIVEAYQGGEKPNFLIAGHYHKFDYSYPREVNAIQVGTTCDQTPFMRKKKLAAHVGGVTLEFDQDDHGIAHNITVRWHPFYDLSFYKGNEWKYHFDNNTTERK